MNDIDTHSEIQTIETLSENQEIKIIYVYRSETMKNAQKKYRENQKEKIAEIQKRYYDKKRMIKNLKRK